MSIDTLLGALIGTTVVVPSLWVFVKRMLVKSAVEDSSMSATGAQNDVIQMLHEEVRRMGDSNKAIGLSLRDFQKENVELRKEIYELHKTVNSLSVQIDELSRLNNMPRVCDVCGHTHYQSISEEGC